MVISGDPLLGLIEECSFGYSFSLSFNIGGNRAKLLSIMCGLIYEMREFFKFFLEIFTVLALVFSSLVAMATPIGCKLNAMASLRAVVGE